MQEKNQVFHVGLKAFVRKGNKLLILRESDAYQGGSRWELPGGRIKATEGAIPLSQILRRELHEECGKNMHVQIGAPILAWRRPTHPEHKVFLVGFRCRYVSGEPKLSPEHSDYAWITARDIEKYNFAAGYRKTIVNYFKK